jgi:UDP:flavonoid glycosyltransferase YjiC (YdhE family)
MHILLVPFGSAGDVHPFVGLGLALRARGHRVTFFLHEQFGPLARTLGFETIPLGVGFSVEEIQDNPDLWHPIRSFPLVMGFAVMAAREVYDRIAERYTPGETIVAGGSLAFGVRLAQEKLGITAATVHLQPGVLRSVYQSPVYPGLKIRDGWPKPLKRLLHWGMDALMVDRHLTPGLNAVRAELGLPPVRRPLESWWNSPQLVLGLFPAWFAPPQPDWPSQVRLTGFPMYDERDETPPDPELDAFLAAGEPPVVFTPGSAMKHGRPFFEAAAGACRLLGRRGVFLTRFPEQVPAAMPEGVRHFAYAPFSRILPRAAAIAHHGGIGTTAQGLAAGLPQLVMPLAHDQFDNAARLARLGVGRALPPKRFRGPAVAQALRALLDSPAVAARCREAAGRFPRRPPPRRGVRGDRGPRPPGADAGLIDDPVRGGSGQAPGPPHDPLDRQQSQQQGPQTRGWSQSGDRDRRTRSGARSAPRKRAARSSGRRTTRPPPRRASSSRRAGSGRGSRKSAGSSSTWRSSVIRAATRSRSCATTSNVRRCMAAPRDPPVRLEGWGHQLPLIEPILDPRREGRGPSRRGSRRHGRGRRPIGGEQVGDDPIADGRLQRRVEGPGRHPDGLSPGGRRSCRSRRGGGGSCRRSSRPASGRRCARTCGSSDCPPRPISPRSRGPSRPSCRSTWRRCGPGRRAGR